MRKFLAPLLLGITTLSLTACLSDDNGCSQPFTTTVTPDSITSSNQAIVGMDKLAFLFSGDGFTLDDVDFEADLSGAHKASENFQLSMNGIKLSRQDGKPVCDGVTPDPKNSLSQTHFKIQNFALNGGLPFQLFLLQLQLQKGKLQLQVNGQSLVVKNAKLTFTGHTQTKCPVKPPNPPPPKVAAVTTLGTITPSATLTNSTSITLAFAANQTGVTFYCSLDNQKASACTSPQSYSGLASAAHDFKVYSVNSAGLTESPGAEYKWTVNAVPPSVTISNLAQLKSLTNQTGQSFQLSSNVPGTFMCSLDGAAFASCPSPQVYANLPDGPHHFAAEAVDTLGNVSGTPATYDWGIDTKPPTVSITSVTPYDPISNQPYRQIQFTASESSTYLCSLDSAAFAGCVSPAALNNLSEGPHLFRIQAIDLAGNLSPIVSTAWTSDYTPPVISIGQASPAPGNTTLNDLNVPFTINETGQVYCAEDGGAPFACSSPVVWNNWGLGQHQLALYAIDVAGNQSANTVLNWNVTNGGAVLSFSQILPSSAFYLSSNNVSLTVNSDQPVTLTIRLNGAEIDPNNPIVLNNLPDGGYSVYAVGVNAAGIYSDPIVHNFIVDTTPPTLTVTSDDTAPVTGLDHRTFTFTASEDVNYLCNLDNQGFGACASPLALSGLGDGPHTLKVQAVDYAGNTTEIDQSWVVQSDLVVAGQ